MKLKCSLEGRLAKFILENWHVFYVVVRKRGKERAMFCCNIATKHCNIAQAAALIVAQLQRLLIVLALFINFMR